MRFRPSQMMLAVSSVLLVLFVAAQWLGVARPAPFDPNVVLILLSLAVIASFVAPWLSDVEKRFADDRRNLLERLEQIGRSFATTSTAPPTATSPPESQVDLSEVATAIKEGRWRDAQNVLDDHVEHPDASKLTARLQAARESSSTSLLAQLEAAKQVSDAPRVLEIRDQLAETMDAEPLRTLDEDLGRWFMPVMMKRLRTGSVGPEVADLAMRVAERLGHTREGASLRASLPTLRRSAGQCPRCLKPYRGIADACPECLSVPAVTSAPPGSDAEVEEVEKLTRPEESPFIDLDEDQ